MENIKIKDIPIADRPRERLFKVGHQNLTNEELLSLLIKEGTRQFSAKEISSFILKEHNGINNLKTINIFQLLKIKGIGSAKASTIMAAIELGRRIYENNSDITKKKLDNPSLIYSYYKNILKDKKQELFYCVYLDNNKCLITDKLLFVGTINASLVHPREIFKEAYLTSASSIICIHNHPSGNIDPSKQDIDLTKGLVEVGKILGIKIVDHIIIGNGYYSFFENGKI